MLGLAFVSSNGSHLSQLADCHWVQLGNDNKFINQFELKEIKGKVIVLTNEQYEVEIFEDKIRWHSIGNTNQTIEMKGRLKL